MRAHRRAGPLLAALVLTTACASTTRVTPVTEGPQVRYRRLMEEAARAGREGRTGEALDKYLEVAGTSGVPELSREAYLQAGLLRLGGGVVLVDVAEATRLLRECRTRFEGAAEPLVLTATLATLDRLESVEQAADAAAAIATREAVRRDEDARALRRTVSSLRQQLEKRDEALRKAAQAAVGPQPR
ncbi:hypothetical protein LuPra_01681 [Luteitalea pratensis]|uniref:Uncharacterized protein n=1 Tax=Luteitalea pratensis TaxID=1855912 RepID=A0A143PIZ5_LUTPR|nr:hypothetical protein [Luteitalea pratensis]AMY08481.1 hypothetical protein LuPra_01681 [Luteitalea pratensis]